MQFSLHNDLNDLSVFLLVVGILTSSLLPSHVFGYDGNDIVLLHFTPAAFSFPRICSIQSTSSFLVKLLLIPSVVLNLDRNVSVLVFQEVFVFMFCSCIRMFAASSLVTRHLGLSSFLDGVSHGNFVIGEFSDSEVEDNMALITSASIDRKCCIAFKSIPYQFAFRLLYSEFTMWNETCTYFLSFLADMKLGVR